MATKGRKPSLSKTKLKKAIPGSGGVLSVIAQKCGVSRVTLWRYLKKLKPDDKIHELIRHEEALLTDIARQHVVNRVVKDDWAAVRFWLLTHAKDDFSYRQEISGPGGGPIQTQSMNVFDLGNGEVVQF